MVAMTLGDLCRLLVIENREKIVAITFQERIDLCCVRWSLRVGKCTYRATVPNAVKRTNCISAHCQEITGVDCNRNLRPPVNYSFTSAHADVGLLGVLDLVFGEELLDGGLGPLDTRHAVALPDQPRHVRRLSTQGEKEMSAPLSPRESVQNGFLHHVGDDVEVEHFATSGCVEGIPRCLVMIARRLPRVPGPSVSHDAIQSSSNSQLIPVGSAHVNYHMILPNT